MTSYSIDFTRINPIISVSHAAGVVHLSVIIESSLDLKQSSDGAIFSFAGSKFHFWTTRYEKKSRRCFFPFTARLFTSRAPFLASLTSQNCPGSILVCPLRILNTSIMSPLSRLCSRDISPRFFLLSSDRSLSSLLTPCYPTLQCQ